MKHFFASWRPLGIILKPPLPIPFTPFKILICIKQSRLLPRLEDEEILSRDGPNAKNWDPGVPTFFQVKIQIPKSEIQILVQSRALLDK